MQKFRTRSRIQDMSRRTKRFGWGETSRNWKGRSYKKGSERVRDLRDASAQAADKASAPDEKTLAETPEAEYSPECERVSEP